MIFCERLKRTFESEREGMSTWGARERVGRLDDAVGQVLERLERFLVARRQVGPRRCHWLCLSRLSSCAATFFLTTLRLAMCGSLVRVHSDVVGIEPCLRLACSSFHCDRVVRARLTS